MTLAAHDPPPRRGRLPALRWIALAAPVLAAASADAAPQPVDLALDSTATVRWGATTLTLTWQGVHDSRCPADAVCVWEGEVAVELAVQPGDAAAQALTLTRQHEGDARASVTVAGFGLRLLGVDPYPLAATPTPRQDYVAHLLVAPPGEDLPEVRTAVEAVGWARVKRRR